MVCGRVTLGVICYNQERFIDEALRSAFAQTYESLDILVSDDCSTDQTWERVCSLAQAYSGPHRVRLNRNAKNIGFLNNLQKLAEISETRVLVIAAGDDVSLSDRVSSIARLFADDPRTTLVTSDFVVMDEDGETGGIEKAWPHGKAITVQTLSRTSSALIVGCTLAYSTEIFRRFPPFRPTLLAEDSVLPFRAALLGNVKYIERPLVRYRQHRNNLSLAARTSHNPAAGLTNARSLLESALQRIDDIEALRTSNQQTLSTDLDYAMELSCAMARKLQRIWNAESGGIAGLNFLFRAVLVGDITISEATKTALRTNFPTHWSRYVKWRHISGNGR